MYSIYHIPGVKIGCSKQPEKRVNQQGYSDFEILETHTDIDIASQREIELQKQYGYEEKFIHTNYKQQIEFGKAGQLACKGKPNKGTQTQIKNKIGIFGYTKEERQKLNASIAHIGGNVTKEKYSKVVNVYNFITNEFITSYPSIKEASRQLKASTGNIRSVICGNRNHTKGYTFRYA
jgi:hypothetical protein